jgi:FkbM family methyltransferase
MTRSSADLIEVETIHGTMLAFENDFITQQILRYGTHTRPEIAFLLSVVEPGDAIFDLGAHIGTYTIPLARKAGRAGKVLAVEARPESWSVLARNLDGAQLGHAVPLNVLIGRAGQRYKAHTPEGNTGGTYYAAVSESGDPIEVVTIDDLCSRHFTPRVIKIDIEGGELGAFTDSGVIQRARPIIYAEVNRKLLALQGASIGALEALLRGQGYRLFRNVGDRHAAHDSFVVAELDALPTNKNNFDVLALHRDDPRLEAFLGAAGL